MDPGFAFFLIALLSKRPFGDYCLFLSRVLKQILVNLFSQAGLPMNSA